jgi:ADP-ribosylglycohydrolase
MLLEVAIGDALGACYEWVEKEIILGQVELKYKMIAPSVVKPGCYTDDTQMTIGIAELMLDGANFTHYNLASKFIECFHRDPRRGYAPGFQMFLEATKTPEDFIKNIKPDSERSGAAMRAGPIGLYSKLSDVREKCFMQSTLTHNTDEGNGSALCAAAMTHYFCYDLGPKCELLNWLNRLYPMPWLPIGPEHLKKYDHIPVKGWPCVMAAIDAIMRSSSLSQLLVNCVNFAGDVDTISAIAMGPASLCNEIDNDIPQCLVDGLENGTYGKDYIVDLNNKLLSKEF